MREIELFKSKKNKVELCYPVGDNIEAYSKVINEIAKILKPKIKKTKLINIWCTGSSGAITSTLLSSELIRMGYKVKIIHIKKNGEESHHSNFSIKYFLNGIHIIIDDFMNQGYTINRIINEMIYNQDVKTIDYIIFCGYCTPHKISISPKYLIAQEFVNLI